MKVSEKIISTKRDFDKSLKKIRILIDEKQELREIKKTVNALSSLAQEHVFECAGIDDVYITKIYSK